MDELTYNPNAATNADTTMQVEGYENQVEEIKEAYPNQDWSTPQEIDEQNQVQAETGYGVQPEQEQQEVAPEQGEAETPTYGPNRFQEYVDPNTGTIPLEVLQQAGYDPELIKRANAHLDYSDTERQAFEKYHEAGGDSNLEATLELLQTISMDAELATKYDRNNDGQITAADWFDLSRMNHGNGPTPQEDFLLTQQWITGLQNKSWQARLTAARDLTPMIPYMHQRRKGMLGPEDELDGEQARSNLLAGLTQVTGDFILSAPEKIQAGLVAARDDGDPDTWFSMDAAIQKDAVLDDNILNHKNPLSHGYAVTNPINRVWSDPLMFELGRYSPAIAASFALPGGWTAISLGGKGLTAKGIATGAFTTARAFGVTWATETIPTNIFADLNSNAMKTFHGDKTGQQLLNQQPQMHVAGTQLMHGIESPTSRQFEFMRGEMAWDAGGLLAGNIIFRSLGRGFKGLTKKSWESVQTSTRAKPKIQQPIDIYRARNQVIRDGSEAAADQGKMAAEGPSSKWNDPWATDGELDSTYGDFKNIKTVSGQQSAGIRSDVYEIGNQIDEIRGQVGIEGGSVDEILTPIQRAEFSRSGIPDPWFTDEATKFWNNPTFADELSKLNPLQRRLGNWSRGTLESIKELMGRDAGRLSVEEFWDGRIWNAPLEPGKKLDEVKQFVIKNLQVRDAVNNSLLKRLKDYANATGEQLGKGDIFAKGGPMSNIAKNLAMGLAEVKKTQFTWDLATKRMKQANGELTPDMIKEIDQIIAGESARITKETNDGVRLLMQVLENSDDDELAEGILDVFKVSNDIHNWKDFDAWMRSKIRGGEFNGKVNTGVMIKELQGVMINSILSGPKTPMRAILGTTTNSYLNAINEAFGATMRRPFTGDIASQKASLAKLNGMLRLVPEAIEVFRKNFKSKWSADIADIRTRYSEGPTRGDTNWHLFGEWTERNGTVADKAAFYLANIARKANNNKLFTWSPRVLAATDDTFKWLMAKSRAREVGMRNALEAVGEDWTQLTPEILKASEDAYYKTFLDADGNLDIAGDAWLNKQFKEVTLTSELKGFSKGLEDVFEKAPLIKPFFLFARTGINGLNFTYKNTPLLGALHKESIDILRHTGDDFTPLFKYGIENANDLANARNLFAGRQAIGAGTVFTFAMMYQAGQPTGNGPADRQLRQQWFNAGWKPNHVYIGGVGFDYRTLEPYNTIFSAIADIGDNMELMGPEWAEKRLQAAAFVIGRGITSKTYLQGLDQLMQMSQFKPGSWDKGAANIMNNSLPLAGLRNEFGKWVNPHMKELNADMWTSIRNRNQWATLAGGKELPRKSDILNGEPLNNYNIIQRSFNAISPVSINTRRMTPGRKLLLDSNYDLKSATYSHGGYSFAKNATVRAHFQNAIGTVPITIGFKKFKNVEEALDHLASRADVKTSMADMKADGKNPANWDLNPNTYPHNTLIDNVMNQARSKAWAKINDPKHPGYDEVQVLKSEKDGHTNRTRDNRSEILELSFPRKPVENFPK